MPFKKKLPFKKEKSPLETEKLKKGQLLVVKAPPLYNKEYLYEISSAGDKLLRANLYHSPRVKKQWSLADLALLFDSGMIRLATDADVQKHSPSNPDLASAQEE